LSFQRVRISRFLLIITKALARRTATQKPEETTKEEEIIRHKEILRPKAGRWTSTRSA
jgi:hypothetical protein